MRALITSRFYSRFPVTGPKVAKSTSAWGQLTWPVIASIWLATSSSSWWEAALLWIMPRSSWAVAWRLLASCSRRAAVPGLFGEVKGLLELDDLHGGLVRGQRLGALQVGAPAPQARFGRGGGSSEQDLQTAVGDRDVTRRDDQRHSAQPLHDSTRVDHINRGHWCRSR